MCRKVEREEGENVRDELGESELGNDVHEGRGWGEGGVMG